MSKEVNPLKAVVKQSIGYDNMKYTNIAEPSAVDNLVKIKIAYSGICGTDFHAFTGAYSGTKAPVVLGHEFSGTVADIGENVRSIKIGDRITSETTFKTCGICPYCKEKEYNLCSERQGLGTQINGSMAEYLVTREESVHKLPDNVSLLNASLTEPLACAVHSVIEKAQVKKGEVVVVFGVGAIGLMVSAVAKSQGAYVIAAGISCDSQRFKIAKQLGADCTVDQTKEDLDKIVLSLTNNLGADICVECSGAPNAANKALQVVKRKGKVVQMGVFSESKVPIYTDLILHKEINYFGSRSQKPSSWHTSLRLLEHGLVNPAIMVSDIITLEDWRCGFESMHRGEGVKYVISCDKSSK